MSCRVSSCHVMSCPVVSCCVARCRFVEFRVVSCRVVSCSACRAYHVFHVMLCCMLFYVVFLVFELLNTLIESRTNEHDEIANDIPLSVSKVVSLIFKLFCTYQKQYIALLAYLITFTY